MRSARGKSAAGREARVSLRLSGEGRQGRESARRTGEPTGAKEDHAGVKLRPSSWAAVRGRDLAAGRRGSGQGSCLRGWAGERVSGQAPVVVVGELAPSCLSLQARRPSGAAATSISDPRRSALQVALGRQACGSLVRLWSVRCPLPPVVSRCRGRLRLRLKGADPGETSAAAAWPGMTLDVPSDDDLHRTDHDDGIDDDDVSSTPIPHPHSPLPSPPDA